MTIYKITNLLDGKVYIGQTVKPFYKRIQSHRARLRAGKDNHYKLYAAMTKYGWENFKFEVIDESATTIEELDRLEKHYIELYDSLLNGYNMVVGGRDNPMDSPQVQENHKNKMQSQEVRDKISKTMKKRVAEIGFSDEHLANLRKASLESYANGRVNWQQGKPISKEHVRILMESRYKKVRCENELGEVYHFDKVYDAAYWLQARGDKANAKSMCGRIKASSREGRPYKGFMWYYE